MSAETERWLHCRLTHGQKRATPAPFRFARPGSAIGSASRGTRARVAWRLVWSDTQVADLLRVFSDFAAAMSKCGWHLIA
jgi:hypothetical protein